jgi:hypothetical protein
MSITSAQGAQFAKRQGVSRVVLGRELSVKEIAMVQEDYDDEIEVFVHGALWYSANSCLHTRSRACVHTHTHASIQADTHAGTDTHTMLDSPASESAPQMS